MTNRTYWAAAYVAEGDVVESFGSFDRYDVDCEVNDWRDHGVRKKNIHFHSWTGCPSTDTFQDWLSTLV